MRASGRIVFNSSKYCLNTRKVVVVREDIRCDIHLYAVVMGKFDALP